MKMSLPAGGVSSRKRAVRSVYGGVDRRTFQFWSDENLALFVYRSFVKWHTEFGLLNRGDMLTSEQHRCSSEKRNFSAEFKRESAQLVVNQNYTEANAAKAMDVGLSTMTRWVKQLRNERQSPPKILSEDTRTNRNT